MFLCIFSNTLEKKYIYRSNLHKQKHPRKISSSRMFSLLIRLTRTNYIVFIFNGVMCHVSKKLTFTSPETCQCFLFFTGYIDASLP